VRGAYALEDGRRKTGDELALRRKRGHGLGESWGSATSASPHIKARQKQGYDQTLAERETLSRSRADLKPQEHRATAQDTQRVQVLFKAETKAKGAKQEGRPNGGVMLFWKTVGEGNMDPRSHPCKNLSWRKKTGKESVESGERKSRKEAESQMTETNTERKT